MGRWIRRGWRGIWRGCRIRCAPRGSVPASWICRTNMRTSSAFIVIGNGGAALAGDMLRGFVAHTAQIPVVIVRGYDVPAFVGPDSIAVALSHSGNTEETVTAFEEAIDRGVKPVIVTTGGTLASTRHHASRPARRLHRRGAAARRPRLDVHGARRHRPRRPCSRRCRERYGRGDRAARRGARRLRPRCAGGTQSGEADGARAVGPDCRNLRRHDARTRRAGMEGETERLRQDDRPLRRAARGESHQHRRLRIPGADRGRRSPSCSCARHTTIPACGPIGR